MTSILTLALGIAEAHDAAFAVGFGDARDGGFQFALASGELRLLFGGLLNRGFCLLTWLGRLFQLFDFSLFPIFPGFSANFSGMRFFLYVMWPETGTKFIAVLAGWSTLPSGTRPARKTGFSPKAGRIRFKLSIPLIHLI